MRKLYIDVDRINLERIEQDIAAKFPHLRLIYDLRVRCVEDRKMPNFLSNFFEWIEELKCNILMVYNANIERLRRSADREDW